MKKLAKLTTLTMTAGLLLAACGDAGDPVDEELPGMDEPIEGEPEPGIDEEEDVDE